MTVVEKLGGAGGGGGLLHDDYSDISHVKINVPVDVEVVYCCRSKYCPR